jgi:hypothetical protein
VHYEHNPRVTGAEREVLLNEAMLLERVIHGLSIVVKSYRDFLERERTRFRGMLRVGSFLVATARTDEERAEASAISEGFEQAFAGMEARDRAPRKRALRDSVAGLRRALLDMNGRVTAALGEAFTTSLYPALCACDTEIVDGDDNDDDATRPA